MKAPKLPPVDFICKFEAVVTSVDIKFLKRRQHSHTPLVPGEGVGLELKKALVASTKDDGTNVGEERKSWDAWIAWDPLPNPLTMHSYDLHRGGAEGAVLKKVATTPNLQEVWEDGELDPSKGIDQLCHPLREETHL